MSWIADGLDVYEQQRKGLRLLARFSHKDDASHAAMCVSNFLTLVVALKKIAKGEVLPSKVAAEALAALEDNDA